MTACILHGTLPAAQPWFCDLGVVAYDFHTLIARVLAIGAAYYAAGGWQMRARGVAQSTARPDR